MPSIFYQKRVITSVLEDATHLPAANLGQVSSNQWWIDLFFVGFAPLGSVNMTAQQFGSLAIPNQKIPLDGNGSGSFSISIPGNAAGLDDSVFASYIVAQDNEGNAAEAYIGNSNSAELQSVLDAHIDAIGTVQETVSITDLYDSSKDVINSMGAATDTNSAGEINVQPVPGNLLSMAQTTTAVMGVTPQATIVNPANSVVTVPDNLTNSVLNPTPALTSTAPTQIAQPAQSSSGGLSLSSIPKTALLAVGALFILAIAFYALRGRGGE